MVFTRGGQVSVWPPILDLPLHSPRSWRYTVVSAVAVLLCTTCAAGQEAAGADARLPPQAQPGEPLVLTPDAAAELAIRRSIQLAVDEEAVRAAEAGLATTDALAQVKADYRGSLGVSGPAPSLPPEFASFFREVTETHRVEARKKLWAGGQVRAQKELAAVGVEAAKAARPVDRRQIALQAREAVYAILRDEELVSIALRQLAGLSEHLRVSEKRYREGLVAFFEVVQAQVQVEALHGQVTEQRLAVERDKVRLCALLAGGQGTPISVEPGRPPKLPTEDQQETIVLALQERPEITQAETNIKLAEGGLAVAELSDRPSLELTAAIQKQTATFISPELTYQVTLSLTKALEDGGTKEGRMQEARARLAQAREGLEAIRHQIAAEVAAQLDMIGAARARLQSAYEQERQARELVRIACLRFEADMGLGREVIDAEAALAQAQANVAMAEYDLNLAIVRLRSAMGLDPLQEEVP